MTKDKRGAKRLCESCGKKFYDLGKEPKICPLCEAPFVVEKATSKVAAKAPAKAPAKEPIEKTPAEPAEEEVPAAKKSATEPEFVSLDEAAAEESSDEDDELAALGDDEDIPDDDAEDVFLEDDEDEAGSDVKGIIGGPIDPKDEA